MFLTLILFLKFSPDKTKFEPQYSHKIVPWPTTDIFRGLYCSYRKKRVYSCDPFQVEEFSEKQITQVKTTILQRTELENIHQRKQKRGMGGAEGGGEEGEKNPNEPEKRSIPEGSPPYAPDNDNGAQSVDKGESKTETQQSASKKQTNETITLNKFSETDGEEHRGGGSVITVVKETHDDGGSGMVGVQSLLDKAQEEIERLRTDNKKLVERELQLKKIARQLALKLKDRKERTQSGPGFPKVDPKLPWVYGITPTYARFTQKADLTRLVQTLLHVTNFHWVVVEDSPTPTKLVANVLRDSGLRYTHLHKATPAIMKKAPKWKKPHRGVQQRNHALKWIRDHVDAHKTQGAVYFMDDDNTYHRKLFDQVGGTVRWDFEATEKRLFFH